MNQVPRDSGSAAGAAGTSRRQVITFAALLAVLLLRGPAAAQGREELSALLPQATLDRARDRAGRLPWAKRVMVRVRREADAWLARPRALPEGKTGLYHDYFCSDHGLGRVLCPDPGTSGYGLALTSDWYRQTLSHNTILVDRRSQQAASGRLVSFHGKGALQHAVASTEEAYPGVTWTRGVYSSEEGYVVVLDRLRPTGESGDRVRIFDWAWHGFGELRVAFPALEPVENSTRFGDADGYQVARNLRTGTTSGPLQAQWRILPQTPTQPSGARPGTGGSLRLWLGAAAHTRMFTAEVPGNPIQNRLAQLVVRRRGARADFAAVFEPVFEGARPVVTRVRSVSGGVEVFTRQGGRTIALPEEE